MTDDNIKEVINRTSIVEIINSTVPLKKKGSNYFGLSPFKKEKTPSFSVNEEKKIFDIVNFIKFVNRYQTLGQHDALQLLHVHVICSPEHLGRKVTHAPRARCVLRERRASESVLVNLAPSRW